jgi:hypothetical protein
VIILDGMEYGTASEIAQALTSTERLITAARIRDWGRRAARVGDPLHGRLARHHRPGPGRGTTWYCLADAAAVELATRHTASRLTQRHQRRHHDHHTSDAAGEVCPIASGTRGRAVR